MAASPAATSLPLALLLWVAVVAMPVAIAASESEAPPAAAVTEGPTGPDAAALFRAVVKVRSRAVAEARSTATLGAEREGTGILLFETVPGLARQLGHHDLLSAIGPRPVMVVSGTQDKYSRDADQVVARVAGDFITELRVERGHALDQERFDAIVEWIVGRVF